MACSSWFDCQVVAVLYIVIKNKNKMPPAAPTLARTPDDKLIYFFIRPNVAFYGHQRDILLVILSGTVGGVCQPEVTCPSGRMRIMWADAI